MICPPSNGLLAFGILGAGYGWLVLSGPPVSTLYSVRAGAITAVASRVHRIAHSTVIPAFLMTCAHFGSSLFRNAANSSGVPGTVSPPSASTSF